MQQSCNRLYKSFDVNTIQLPVGLIDRGAELTRLRKENIVQIYGVSNESVEDGTGVATACLSSC